MKRSEINRIIGEGVLFMKSLVYFFFPNEAYWDLRDWLNYKGDASERLKRGIGWDVTDFGLDNFKKEGLLSYVLTNGIIKDGIADQMYAEKYLIVGNGQITPQHHHKSKIEDIVNMDGGNLKICLHSIGDLNPVKIFHNYEWIMYDSGTIITLKKNDRIRLDQNHDHEFLGEGMVFLKEISSFNDDKEDNVFLDGRVDRFPKEIKEDEAPRYLLHTELPGTKKFEVLVRKWL